MRHVIVYLCLIVAVACGGGSSSPTAPTPTPPPPPQTSPDLTVGSASVTDNSPETGGSLTLSATVTNSGDAEAAATTLRYYRSTDATITTSDTGVGTAAVAALAASGTSAASIDLTAPSTPGTYYYGACVDAVSGESDATNNCSASAAVTVTTPMAQLQSTGQASFSNCSPFSGDCYLDWSIQNVGRGCAVQTTAVVRLYDATDAQVGSDVAMGGVVGLSSRTIRPNEIVPISSIGRIIRQIVDRVERVRLFPTWSNVAC